MLHMHKNDLHTDTWIKGFRLIFENAQRLYKAAEVLEEKKEYPIANSLLILAAEEAVKAYIVITQHFFPGGTVERFDEFFEQHKTKLDAIRGITGYYTMFKKFDELLYRPRIEAAGKSDEEFESVKKESFQNIKSWLQAQVDSKAKSELSVQAGWWRQAKDMREKGFYVSLFNNVRWESPAVITKKKYIQTKEYVSGFMSLVEQMYNADMNDNSVTELVDDLKELIATAMSDKDDTGDNIQGG
jgi:AbiV family abortive infection protein